MCKLRILIARSIFCPDDENYDISINGLLSLFDFLTSINNDKVEFSLFVTGWIKKQYSQYFLNVIELNKGLFQTVEHKIWFINYGKYRILNEIKQIANSYDSVFYSDHDIKVSLNHYGNVNFFTDMQNAFNNEVNNKKIGLIALNHTEDIRHQYDIYQNCIKIKDTEYVYPDDGNLSSIACGCFYINGNNFFEIKQFKLHSVYGLDDYYLLKYLYYKNIASVVIKNTYIIHPFCKNNVYNLWKTNKIKLLINDKHSEHNKQIKNNYFMDIQETNNLWNNLNNDTSTILS